MGEIGYFWKNADNQLPAEAGLVQHYISVMRAKWLKFGILASIKVRASGQCIAPKTRTTLILDRYLPY